MEWTNRKVLVTGAGGFIGSHLVERLAANGADVRAFVHYNSRGDLGLLRHISPQYLPRIEIAAGDLRDPYAVEQAVSGSEYIFHLGALISIPYSYQDPAMVLETNVLGTLNVLMASRKHKVARVVQTSTSEVYGTALQVPITEAHPLYGQSPYSASKIGADKLAESFYCSYGLPVVILRPFNTFGPRQSARAVIPAIITQALSQKKIRIGNMETTRDFTFVSDTVAGFIKMAETAGIEGKTIHLGTGREVRISDLVKMVIEAIDPFIELEIDQNRLRPMQSEVFRLVSDNSLARKVLGWQPETGLEEGLTKTIEWIQQHMDLYRIGTYEY